LNRLLLALLFCTGCTGSNSGASGAGTPQTLSTAARTESARSVPSVALRIPAGGGPLRAYLLPALQPAAWAMGGRASPARSVIGMDDAGRRLLYRDSAGLVQAFDLVAYRERPVQANSTYAGRRAIATLSSDGTLYAITPDGTVIESEPWGASEWPNSLGAGVREAFAGVGAHLLALRRRGADTLALAARETGISLKTPVPAAAGRGASRDGDAVAFATDSGLVVVEDREPRHPWSVRLKGSPVAAAFTPSGHRIYVALKAENELAVVDRFARRTLPPVQLPGPAAALRADPWGRVVLVRPADQGASDETWIVSVASGRVAGHVNSPWASDLPTVSEGGALLVREDGNVVARDIHTFDSLGTVVAGAADLWFVGRWKPTTAPNVLRETAVAPAPRAARPTPGGVPPRAAAPAPPPERIWVQVSVSQNEKASRDLAVELTRSGHPAQVSDPRSPGEGWRVVIGPFLGRTAADSAGRVLGRPYYLLDRGPEGPVRQ
jgi:hypothetical protein